MPEEIKHYVAPIAVLPKGALLHAALNKAQQRLKLATTETSKQDRLREVQQAQKALDAYRTEQAKCT